MKRSLALPFALLGTLLLVGIDVLGHMTRDSSALLLQPVTPGMLKTGVVIVLLWYAAFFAFVMVSRYRQVAEDEERDAINHRPPAISLPARRRPHPPTQPIPVPPSDEVSAVNK